MAGLMDAASRRPLGCFAMVDGIHNAAAEPANVGEVPWPVVASLGQVARSEVALPQMVRPFMIAHSMSIKHAAPVALVEISLNAKYDRDEPLPQAPAGVPTGRRRGRG